MRLVRLRLFEFDGIPTYELFYFALTYAIYDVIISFLILAFDIVRLLGVLS